MAELQPSKLVMRVRFPSPAREFDLVFRIDSVEEAADQSQVLTREAARSERREQRLSVAAIRPFPAPTSPDPPGVGKNSPPSSRSRPRPRLSSWCSDRGIGGLPVPRQSGYTRQSPLGGSDGHMQLKQDTPFADRHAAGRALAAELLALLGRSSEVVVLAL